MDYETILYDLKEGVATITFNRPKSLNALNNRLLTELEDVLDHIQADESVRVLILTGAGEKAFVAGADISELAQLNALQAKRFSRKGQRVIGKLETLSIPVIGAVNGFALGGGTEMALACDFVYAADTAKFGLPEINLGLIPGFGGTQRLPLVVGPAMAREMIYTGKMITAQEAWEAGMVNRVFPVGDLMKAAAETARTIAQKGRVSLRAAKEAVNKGLNVDIETGCHIECDAFALTMASEDAKEGTMAFLEKRKPEFKGCL